MVERITIDEVLAKARKAVEIIDSVSESAVPQTAKAAIAEDWAEVGVLIAGGWIDHIPKAELEEWRGRVITLKKADELLAGFEESVVAAYTASPKEIFFHTLVGQVK